MWLFTKHGFFSVVCARQGDSRQRQPIDTTRLMVRARVRGHLEALKKRWPDQLGACDIRTSAGTDYAFRMFVDKPAWSRVLSELALETDYDNFKAEVARYQGRAGGRYERSLHEVWSVMHELQGSRTSRHRATPRTGTRPELHRMQSTPTRRAMQESPRHARRPGALLPTADSMRRRCAGIARARTAAAA